MCGLGRREQGADSARAGRSECASTGGQAPAEPRAGENPCNHRAGRVRVRARALREPGKSTREGASRILREQGKSTGGWREQGDFLHSPLWPSAELKGDFGARKGCEGLFGPLVDSGL
jgi:hypothetical protein